jgi:hypothetical protein
MAYKTIVAHCDGRPSAARRLDTVATLVERFGSHPVGVYAKSPFESPVFMENCFDMARLFQRPMRHRDGHGSQQCES